ncbi:MAG: YggT family protein [Chloroflexi bacterium]|jgi:YggT family protein|nr:YggT family protein [Chloroflexota bacterium]
MGFLIVLVDTLFRVLTLIVFVDVLLSFFMSPYHPIRQNLDRIVEPMLAPIRRVVPPVSMIDFSPMVLLILLQILRVLIISVLRAF